MLSCVLLKERSFFSTLDSSRGLAAIASLAWLRSLWVTVFVVMNLPCYRVIAIITDGFTYIRKCSYITSDTCYQL